jgi:hypothetical protein
MLAVALVPTRYTPALWMLMRGESVAGAARRTGVRTQSLQGVLVTLAAKISVFADVAEGWAPAERLAEKHERARAGVNESKLGGVALAAKLRGANRLLRAIGEPGVSASTTANAKQPL